MISATGVFSSVNEETYIFESGESVSATKTSISGTNLEPGDSIACFKGVDLLFGLGGEDFIDIDFNPPSVTTICPVAEFVSGVAVIDPATGLQVNTPGQSRFTPLTPGAIYEAYSQYDLGTGVFSAQGENTTDVDPTKGLPFDQDPRYIVGAAKRHSSK